MKTTKRTYVLPAETLESFEQRVASGQRSAVIAELLREWGERQQREQRRREIIEGMPGRWRTLYQEIEREYHPLEEEVQVALDA